MKKRILWSSNVLHIALAKCHWSHFKNQTVHASQKASSHAKMFTAKARFIIAL